MSLNGHAIAGIASRAMGWARVARRRVFLQGPMHHQFRISAPRAWLAGDATERCGAARSRVVAPWVIRQAVPRQVARSSCMARVVQLKEFTEQHFRLLVGYYAKMQQATCAAGELRRR